MVDNKCTICGIGTLTDKIEINEHVKFGMIYKYPSHYSECNHCLSEYCSPEQLSLNKKITLKVWEEQNDKI